MASEYIPGVCNIGRAEITMRKVAGWIGVVSTFLLWGALSFTGAAPVLRLSLFLPAFLGAIGFVQASMGFCAKYGFGGVFSFGPNVGKTDTVEQAEYRKQDRLKALQIIGISLGIGLLVAGIGYFVPV